jgi:arylsulfatase A-like enzyme
LSNSIQSIDIGPTILDTLGIPVPEWMDGVPLTQAEKLDDRDVITLNYKDPLYGKIYDRPTRMAIRWHQFKMIVSCDAPRDELYDVSEDPGEERNLSTTQPLLMRDLRAKLEQRLVHQKARCEWHAQITQSRD